ncbi:MAG: OmpH family outer membrane protein [Acidobacteriaceae bacterium]|nr:OmpH family outer membrane protein [Acidobacteriaceae bacterium]
MVKRSKWIVAVAALAGLALGANAQQPPAKVGVISVQGAIVGTKDGQKASQELDAKFQPKKKDFDARQAEIAQLQDQYNKSGSVMSEDKRQQLARDIDEKKKRLERDTQDAQEELQGDQQRLLQSLGQRMMAVIEKYAKDNAYTMILDVSNPQTPVLYASSGIDITQDIISLYDKSSANGGPATAPATPGATPKSGTGASASAAKTPGTPRP